MTLELTLPPDLAERLRHEAERRGQPSASLALDLLDQSLPPATDKRREAALAMLKQWMEEDANGSDPAEAEDFFRNLDAARSSNRPLFPAELKGITW